MSLPHRGDPASHPPVLVLLGPTAAGKSGLSLELAALLGGEILSADSMQVYRGLDIGTDKVPPAVRARVPHHLLDVLDPDESMDAGRWVGLADEAIRDIRARGRVPIVVGGTGLYVRGLLKGFFDGPSRDPELRARLRAVRDRRNGGWLHGFLRRLDAAAATRIGPADDKRLVRAVEVILHTGIPFTDLKVEWSREDDRYDALKIALRRERNDLQQRIDARVRKMFDAGLLEEVRRLIESGVPEDSNAFKAIGYRQALGVIQGRHGRAEAIRLTQVASRQYAKRQMSWFRSESDLHWIDASEDLAQVARRIAGMYHLREQSAGPGPKSGPSGPPANDERPDA